MNEQIAPTFDNADTWKRACQYAVSHGILDATMGEKARTEKEVIVGVKRSMGLAHCSYRNGHVHALRRAYGAAYNGIKLTKRALASKNPNVNPQPATV